MEYPKIPPGASLSFHMCMAVDTALDMALGRNGYQPQQDENGIYQMDDSWPKKILDILGYPLNTHQSVIVNELNQMKKDGQDYIPSEGCDNYGTVGRCKGHVKRGVTANKVHV